VVTEVEETVARGLSLIETKRDGETARRQQGHSKHSESTEHSENTEHTEHSQRRDTAESEEQEGAPDSHRASNHAGE
jgi:hypothetical protein